MAEDKRIAMTYIDYSTAFDDVSHKYMDKALKDVGTSPKTRSMFRAVYRVANTVTKVVGPDGETTFSEAFPVSRDVVKARAYVWGRTPANQSHTRLMVKLCEAK